MGQRGVPAPFLTKTYEMVDDGSTNDVVSWGQNGDTFVVWKTADFARDLLPSFFKHNNFSSFVRQLNTYGFRKVVPDKWEFANENFKRGRKELLSQIRRRKAAPTPQSPPAGKAGARGTTNPATTSNSGEDVGSTSTSSPDSKNPGSVDTAGQLADLSDENEKLKREKERLRGELEEAKKKCEELMALLTGYLKVGPDQINGMLGQSQAGHSLVQEDDNDDDDDNKEGLKLFGVWLKKKNKKRERCCEGEVGVADGSHPGKVMKKAVALSNQ